MNPCTDLLVKEATDHYAHLLQQGKRPSEALDHAVQRFGVTRGAILRENRSRHEFDLPADVDHVVSDYETFLDMFSCAGGASAGYRSAGFNV